VLVLDASVLAEYIVGSERGQAVARRLARITGLPHLPDLAIAETVSVVRSWVARGELDESAARVALVALRDFPGTRYPSELLIPRIWELRHNLTSYDAHYVALAELLDLPLYTADARIGRATGHTAHVEILD
jgi:predicted nucleic acid-binding protein